VNKIDRAGADDERVLAAISERLTPAIVPLGSARALGTRAADFAPFDRELPGSVAEVLAERDDDILAAYVDEDEGVSHGALRVALAEQTKRALVHPVFFGAAITGAGVPPLLVSIPELLPSASGDPDGALAATVFKIERASAGEKVAYVRMFSGTLRVRDRVRFGRGLEGKVTALAVFERGPAEQRPAVSAGAIAKVWGLREIQIGDRIGEAGADATAHEFAPPTLESVVEAADPGERASLRVALAQLAEQDPLINVRQDVETQDVSVSLYGEVQREVIQATLADEYGIDALFREVTPIYVERPVEPGEALEILHAETNPFNASIGFRVEPAPDGSGVEFRVDVDTRTVPLYVFKTLGSFTEHMQEYVRETLREGLSGWQVVDCVVTMNRCGYSVPDGPPSRRGPLSTAADFRKLTPLVFMQALQQAGTVVCEPVMRASVEIPTETIGAVVPALARLGAIVETSSVRGKLAVVETLVPAARVNDVQRHLPGLTRGEGVLESTFAGYEPVAGEQPTRRRTTPSPLNLDEYVMHLARR
jgi:ribosomal protection tetracycline resistance protein